MSAANQTVLIVHGTFSGPSPDSAPCWYAPGESFPARLDAALADAGSDARCWRHLKAGEQGFSWDGANDWLSRAKTATRLRDELQRLHRQGWTVHLVAHSHGGNVVLEAITNERGDIEPWFGGRAVLLGTPVYLDSSKAEQRAKGRMRRWAIASLIAWLAMLVWAAQGVPLWAAFVVGSSTDVWGTAVAVAGLFAVAVLLGRPIVRFVSDKRLHLPASLLLYWFPNRDTGRTRRSPALLFISSRLDEAFRSLSVLPDAANPLLSASSQVLGELPSKVRAIVESTSSRLTGVVRRAIGTRHVAWVFLTGALCASSLLFWQRWAAVWFSPPLSPAATSLAFWSVVLAVAIVACLFDRLFFFPGILVIDGLGAVLSAIRSFVLVTLDRVIRSAVWAFTQAASLGLGGSPRAVDDVRVDRRLGRESPEDCLYLELPDEITAQIVTQQEGQLYKVHKILYGDATTWSPSELRQKLEMEAFPLIHTAYYCEDACVRQMAAWIALPNDRKWFDGTLTVPTVRSVGPSVGGTQAGYLEDFELGNEYRRHLEDLWLQFCPPGSVWETPEVRAMSPAERGLSTLGSRVRHAPPKRRPLQPE